MKRMKKSLSGILAAVLWISVMSGCAAEKPDSVFQQNMTAAATAPLDEKILLTDTVTSQDGTAEYTICLNQQLTSAPLPIAQAVPHRLTGEDAKRVAQALFADAPFYEREHEENAAYSKEQLQKRIRWMTELASREALTELYGGEEYVEDTLESLRFWLQKYTVQMETAPTENPHTPCEWTFQKDKHYAASYNSWGDDWIIATVDFGEVNYNVICGLLGSNWYALLGTLVLAAGVVVHFVYAIILTLQNRKARGNDRYAINARPKGVEWASQNMFVLGVIVILFMVLHFTQFWYNMMFAELAGIHGDIHPQDGAAFINFYFQGNVVNTVLYLIWFVALWFHLTHGFWSAIHTIGWNNTVWLSRWECISKWVATIICGLFAVITVIFYLNGVGA